jgi:molybdopterin-guanine dinucleotide biosynthesis protein A
VTVAAVILAGGLSSRLGGGDKPLLELAGEPILAHAIRRLKAQADIVAINANGDAGRFATYGLPVIADIKPGNPGPLGGVQAGMHWATAAGASQLLTVAGDTPFFPADLLQGLVDASKDEQIAVATSSGQPHPTFALWPTSLADDLDAFLASGGRKVTAMIERHPHISVEFAAARLPGGAVDPFFNINTPDDLAQARRLMETSGA